MVKVTIEADADTIVQLANAAERRALQNKDANRMDRYENLMVVVEDLDDAVTNRGDSE